MARHKAELPSQPVERAIDIPNQPIGRQAQQAKRVQRQYRQRGRNEEAEGDFGPSTVPDQAAGVAAVTRMQEQEYEARSRAKRARGELATACAYACCISTCSAFVLVLSRKVRPCRL